MKSCTISKKKDKAGTLDAAVQFLPSAGCWGLRCGIALAFSWLSVCVLGGEVLSVSRSVAVVVAAFSHFKYPGVWPSLKLNCGICGDVAFS